MITLGDEYVFFEDDTMASPEPYLVQEMGYERGSNMVEYCLDDSSIHPMGEM